MRSAGTHICCSILRAVLLQEIQYRRGTVHDSLRLKASVPPRRQLLSLHELIPVNLPLLVIAHCGFLYIVENIIQPIVQAGQLRNILLRVLKPHIDLLVRYPPIENNSIAPKQHGQIVELKMHCTPENMRRLVVCIPPLRCEFLADQTLLQFALKYTLSWIIAGKRVIPAKNEMFQSLYII